MTELTELITNIIATAEEQGRVCPVCGLFRKAKLFQRTTAPDKLTAKQRREWLKWMTLGTGAFPSEPEIPCHDCGRKPITLIGSWEQNTNHPASHRATLLQRWYGASIAYQPGDQEEEPKYRSWLRATLGNGKAKTKDYDWTAKPWLD